MQALLFSSYAPMARVLERGLQEEGFEVDRIDNLDDFEDRVGEGIHDVCVIDLLPQQKPTLVLRQWQQWELDVPLVVLTVDAEQGKKAQPKSGACEVLVKPFSWAELSDCLIRLIPEHEPASTT